MKTLCRSLVLFFALDCQGVFIFMHRKSPSLFITEIIKKQQYLTVLSFRLLRGIRRRVAGLFQWPSPAVFSVVIEDPQSV
ncbi:hypothetical protein FFE93_019145 [Yersinia sp. KBS0713]|nr:hypothetical protein FFE93_019145 [Yersinia sp. KBS0713]